MNVLITKKGFSLIEVLVAVALLSLLITLLSGVLDKVATVTGRSTRNLNVGWEGQGVLSTIGQDLDRILLESGGALLVSDRSSGPWGAAFCGIVPGRSAQGEPYGRFQTVAFWIAEQNGAPVLRRATQTIDWSNENQSLLEDAVASASRSIESTISSSDNLPDKVASDVIRLALRVQDSEGNRLRIPNIEMNPSFPNDLLASSDWRALTLDTATGLTVTIAVVDPSTRITFADQLESLANALPDSDPDRSPMETWAQTLKSGELAHFPAPLIANVRFYERTYLLK